MNTKNQSDSVQLPFSIPADLIGEPDKSTSEPAMIFEVWMTDDSESLADNSESA